MSTLDVPGATLYYETRGNGPLLLMVPGAGGAADVFMPMAEVLAEHYTVAMYDRRGFSRSRLDGPQVGDRRLAIDATDVRRLVEHLSDEPATLFGGSSGGIVVLEVIARHPDVVRTIVPFEPPVMRVLPDGGDWIDFFFGIYDSYRRCGVEPALQEFRERAFTTADSAVMAQARRTAHSAANAVYWFEHELRQYPAADLDLGALTRHGERITLAIGRESFGHPACEASIELSVRLGCERVELPGGHAGYMAHPRQFAGELLHTLGRKPLSRTIGRT